MNGGEYVEEEISNLCAKLSFSYSSTICSEFSKFLCDYFYWYINYEVRYFWTQILLNITSKIIYSTKQIIAINRSH